MTTPAIGPLWVASVTAAEATASSVSAMIPRSHTSSMSLVDAAQSTPLSAVAMLVTTTVMRQLTATTAAVTTATVPSMLSPHRPRPRSTFHMTAPWRKLPASKRIPNTVTTT